MKELIVKNNENKKISKYIMDYFPSLNYITLKKAFRNKDIKLNSKRINDENILVNENDKIELYISDNLLFNIPKSMKYIYEDENILVCYKWQGILSNNESSSILNEPTFEEIVRKDLNNENLYICHRLDRNTAGIVIFAKSKEIFEEIKELFKSFNIEKHYIAYVNNASFSKNHDILCGYILKDSKNGISRIYEKKIKDAEEIKTEYNLLKKDLEKNYAILDVVLHTGKMHQIRAHMAYINHNIIGDSKYGINEVNKKIKKNKQMLYAYKYIFNNIPKNSILNYLNGKIIELKEDLLNLI